MPSMKRSRSGSESEPAVQAQSTGMAAAGSLSPHQWSDVVQYLKVEDLKALRLAGGKELHLADPSLTCHLQLRMDKAPFFTVANSFKADQAEKWLTNRQVLVINDASPKICPHRVAHLVAKGFLDSVTQLVIFDCHAYRNIFTLLAQLPNLESLKLLSHASDQDDGVMDDLEFIVTNIGRIHSLKHLDVEFDCVLQGSRLNWLKSLRGLESLRLRGFDLSDGLISMAGLKNLSSLHLCHGNFFSSPNNDVDENDLLMLMGLTNLEQVHLEGFDCLSNIGLKPFSTTPASVKRLVLKHCQDLSEECLPSIGRMTHLTSLHLVHSAYDEVPIFDGESLGHLNELASLKSLSLFYVLEDNSDLRELWGLGSLETLNIALEYEPDEDEVDELCQTVLAQFGSLRKLRIFSEDGMSHSYCRGKLEVEQAPFTFGDLVYLE